MKKMLSYFKIELERYDIHYDAETTNLSFIKMSMLLKQKGIQNNKWMLALCQKELVGVNPYDPNLSYALKIKIGLECKINPMYFFREVARVPATGSDPIPFKLDPGNMIVLFLVLASIDMFYVIARQIGKTVTMLAIYEYLIYICYYKSASSMVTQNDKLRVENISRLKLMRDALPNWLLSKSIKDSDNKEELYYAALGNKLLTFVGSADKNSADSKVRGLSVPFLGWDEFPYTKNNETMFKGATATMSTASDQAKESGVPTANGIFTTAGDLTTDSGKFGHDLVLGCMFWNDLLFDSINEDDLRIVVKANSVNDMVYITKSYLQLGKDHAWLEERKRRGALTEADIDRDFRGIWSLGNEEYSVVDPGLLKLLNEYQLEPQYVQKYQDTYIFWFKSKAELSKICNTLSLVMGCDGSETIGSDFTTFVIMDTSDVSVIGSCKCNISNLLHLSEMIFNLLMKYKRMVFIPERNSTGAAILDNLLIFFERAGINPYKRIFNTFIDTGNNLKLSDISNLGNPLGTAKKQFGYRTTSKSRDVLYNTVLLDSISECKTKIHDIRIIEEIQGLTKKNGRIDHKVTGHDDLLVAWLLCLWFIKYARNTYLYDIDSNSFMAKHIDPHAKFTKQQVQQQLQLRNRKDGLIELIEISPSNAMKEIYKRELRLIEFSINEEIITPAKTASNIEEDTRNKKKKQKDNITATLHKLYPHLVTR